MKKSLKGLLLALVAVSPAFASKTNNKTHLNTRICRDGVPAFTTFHEMQADKNDDRIGGNVEVTGFYGRSVNGSHLGKSFGADGTDSIRVMAGTPAGLATMRQNGQVLNDLLLHNVQGATNYLAGVLKFDPKQTVYGARLDYFQRFDKWLDGLFFALNVPFVHVRNDINMKVSCDAAGLNSTEGVKLQNLFSGKTITRTLDENAQDALCYGKMCGNTKTGLGDIEAQIGWRFLEGRKYHVGTNIAVVFPTSEKPNAKYLWGARTGECKWGLGLGADASAILWEEEDQNLKIIGCVQYKYLFDGDERRTLGLTELKYKDGTTVKLIKEPLLSPYYLVGTAGKTGLKPLANVSTLDLKVKARNQIDGIIAFAYNNAGFTIDVGYNLFWKQAEKFGTQKSVCDTVCPTACPTDCPTSCSGDWKDDTYAVANPTTGYAANAVFATDGTNSFAGTTDAGTTDGFISSTQLDYDGAATPSQFVHKVFAGVGYIEKSWEYPVMVGAGVAYDIPSSNRDAAEGYSFWAKAGIAF